MGSFFLAREMMLGSFFFGTREDDGKFSFGTREDDGKFSFFGTRETQEDIEHKDNIVIAAIETFFESNQDAKQLILDMKSWMEVQLLFGVFHDNFIENADDQARGESKGVNVTVAPLDTNASVTQND